MLVATALSIASLLPFTFWLTDSMIDDSVMDDLLSYELSTLLARGAPSFEVDTPRGRLRFDRRAADTPDELPDELRALEPGSYRAFRIDGVPYSVQVRATEGGGRAYLGYDLSFVEDIKLGLWAFVMSLAALITLAVWVFARRMVDRALAPFSRLVAAIGALWPGERNQRIDLPRGDWEISLIVDALNQYLSELDAVIERERTFAGAAGHELRTPLTVIQGSVGLIEQVAAVPERVRRRLVRAVRELCDDLDALLALSPSRVPPAPVRLRLDEWAPQVAEAFLSQGNQDVRIEWGLKEPTYIVAPAGAVNVVFSNLLRNAVRASKGGPIRIDIARGQVTITDSGPGIPPQDLPHVFEPRFRGHDGGTGLGLYIVRSLALQYGWEVDLRNCSGGGLQARWRFMPASESSP